MLASTGRLAAGCWLGAGQAGRALKTGDGCEAAEDVLQTTRQEQGVFNGQ